MLRSVLFSSEHLHAQAQPRVGHKVAVKAVAGTSRLTGVEANFRAFLMAVDGLHRAVDIHHPRHAQDWLNTGSKMISNPLAAVIPLDALHCPAHHVFA